MRKRRKTYMSPDGLLYAQHPCPPPIFIDTHSLDVTNFDSVKRPVVGNFQLDLQLMFVYGVRCSDFIHSSGDLDRQVVVCNAIGSRMRTNMFKFGLNEDRREVCRGVRCEGLDELAIFAVEDP